ncbi:MAG: EamA family transporter [Candidatus Hadarchaeaceae archaeon]
MAVLTALSWSLSEIIAKIRLRKTNSIFYSSLRMLIAAVIFIPVILVISLKSPRLWFP